MIYTAASPSLAVLEVLVHLDVPSELLPNDYQLLTINLPGNVPVSRTDHPIPDDDACRHAGDAFLADAVALALVMPSVVVPQERNVLLNPLNAQMRHVTVERTEAFQIVPRLVA